MFSKELQELDRNTAYLMLEELYAQIAEINVQIAERNVQIAEKNARIAKERAQPEYLRRSHELHKLLAKDHRFEDFKHALKDKTFCDKLLKEYGLDIE